MGSVSSWFRRRYLATSVAIAVLATALVSLSGVAPAGAASEEVNFEEAISLTAEGSAPVIRVRLTFDTPLAGDVVVNITASATGVDPAEVGDYDLATGSVTFFAASAPTSGATLEVPLTFESDLIFENSETLLLTITSATGAAVGVNDTHVATIANDDEAPTLRMFDSTADEDTGAMLFTVTRNGETELTATALANPTGGSAAAGSDFTAGTHPISIAPGGTSASGMFTVSLTNDDVFELTETLDLTLSALGAASPTGSDLVGVGTIIDDEDPPTVQVNNVSISEGAGTATFTVTRIGLTDVNAEVDIATSDGTASAGDDYVDQNTTVTIPAGGTTASETLAVPIIDDDIDEPNETYNVNLSDPVAAEIVGGSGTGTIIDDDVPGVDFDLGNGLIALEGSDPDTFDVVLTSEPAANVTVSAASIDDETAVTPSDLTFTPASWDKPQSFTVTALEDGIDEDDPHNGLIRITTDSTDPGYGSLPDTELIAIIGDADALLVRIDGPSVGLPGTPATFTATVNAGATGDITYEWTAFLRGEAIASGDKSIFNFTPSAGGPYIVQVLVGDSEGQNPAEFIPFRALSDVGTSVFADDIVWLAEAGITQGCNPPDNDLFCPQDVVTRGQMAAFMVRFLGLTNTGGGNTFTDDNDSIFEDDIAKLAAAGITRGCNPPANTNYCPNSPVTREQMAAFMVRALGLTDDGGGNAFTDDNDSIFEDDIAKLAAAGITRGCNPPANTNYCPNSAVTREQMAAFVHRAANLETQ